MKPPAPFDIYLAKVNWKDCADARPWLVIAVNADETVLAFPISGACYQGPCFEIDEHHCRQCGLTKTSYIHDVRLYVLRPGELVKYQGKLEGELLRRFLAHAGIAG